MHGHLKKKIKTNCPKKIRLEKRKIMENKWYRAFASAVWMRFFIFWDVLQCSW